MICNDVKLTLFKTTAAYREKVLGHKCYCWNPTDPDRKTHCYNPLTFISKDKCQRITDIQRIAHIFIPDNKKSDPIWQQASRKLFKVGLLYLLDNPDKPVILGEINRLVKQPSFDDWLAEQLDNTKYLDPEFYRNGYSYLNNHEKTRSSILETFSGYFELFEDPFIDAATATSDFDLSMLRRSLKLLREYRVRCVLMLQYIAQTYEQYTHDEAKAFTNIKTKIAFATEDLQDTEYISKLLGMRTIRVASNSTSHQIQGRSDSKSYQYQSVPLSRADEVMKLSQNKTFIMRTNNAPVKAEQFIRYNESKMKHAVSHQ